MLFQSDMAVAAPAAAVAALHAKSSRLGLKLIPSMTGAYWGVLEQWRFDDPRYERIQRGEIPAGSDMDLIQTFSADMRAEDVVSWVATHYGDRVLDTRDAEIEALRRSIEIDRANTAKKEARLNAFLADSEQKVKDDTPHQRRLAVGADTVHPMVSGFGDAPPRNQDKPKKRKATTPE